MTHHEPGDFALAIVLTVALGGTLLRCGTPPSTTPPPPPDAGHVCGPTPCCDAGEWVCTTTNVPCECPR